MQREVWNSIANLDRPYKKGIRGIDTNLNPDGPSQPELEDLGFPRRNINDDEIIFRNEDRFISNTPFIKKHNFKHIAEWEHERLHRPVTKNFNSKGYKYEVPINA